MGYGLYHDELHHTEIDILMIALNERYHRGEIDFDELCTQMWECAQLERSVYQNQDIALSGISSRRDDDRGDQCYSNSSKEENIVDNILVDTAESCNKIVRSRRK